MPRLALIACGLVALAAGVLACSSGSRAEADTLAVDAHVLDTAGEVAGSDTALEIGAGDVPGADASADTAVAPDVDASPAWVLPPCYRACDRVTACGVTACLGYDWGSAGTLFEACFAACDEPWAASVLAAPGCPEVEAAATGAIADYAVTCTTNPCDPACSAFAACVVSACEALAPSLEAGIASDCHAWCTPPSSVWMVETPCADLVAALDQGDPAFATTCHGAPSTCAGADLCVPWGAKVAGCVVANCDASAAPYQAGLALLLGGLCQQGADCPAVADVQAGLAPEVTCAAAGFDSLGHQEPFTALCDGTLGVTQAQVTEACGLLATCPGAEWLGGVEGCSAFLVLTPSAAQRTQCLQDAVDCTGAYACLEGL